jgi:selenium metabolism protein YedF
MPPGGSFIVRLDSEASRDNVLRFAGSRGAEVEVSETGGGDIQVIITAPAASDTETPFDKLRAGGRIGQKGKKPPVVLITSDTIGNGDDKLGRILMEGFINTLPDQDSVPDRILLLNTGVKLAVEGSEVLDTLAEMADRGCEINACGTCLEFFSLKEKLAVGTVSNMFDIQKTLLETDTVIKI